MNHRIIVVAVAALALLLAPNGSAQTVEGDREQDHDELRALLRVVTEAVNTQDLDMLASVMHDTFSVTMVDQAHGTSIDQMREDFRKRFEDEGALLDGVHVDPSADILTEFISENVGVNYGTSVDTYTLKSGRTVVLNSRWTATTIKTDDGWKVATVHAGVNMLDNPILTALEKARWVWGVGGLVVGLLVGVAFAFLKRSR